MKKFIKNNNLGEFVKKGFFKDLVSIKVGGMVKGIIYPNDINSLIRIIKKLNKQKKKYFYLGNGTNVVPSERYYRGYIISMKKSKMSITESNNQIEVTSNYPLTPIAIKMAEKGYDSLAFLSGIPGTIGGAVFMNAGAYKHEIKDIFISAKIIDQLGRVRTISRDIASFSYRDSIFRHNNWIILSVTLDKGKKGKYAMEQIKNWKSNRMQTQPLNYPNAGSVFKNFKNNKAWELIDFAGLRGYTIGNACVSPLHANFIINKGGAKGEDIYKLIKHIQKKVYETSKIKLESEIIFFNFKKL